MKTEFADVNETRKTVHVEIPTDIVSAEIERVARTYSRTARVPGFRPGKTPPRVIKQRFKDQILHDVAHDLVPRAVGDALRERGMEAIDTPDVRDVTIEEGQPLTFTASFETVPAFEPGDYATIALRRPGTRVEDGAVDEALERLRQRSARYEPVEGRGVDHGDSVVVDLVRFDGDKEAETHKGVTVDMGAAANPPGFDEALLGLEPKATKTFTLHYPSDYAVTDMAGQDITYSVVVDSVKRRIVPELDDEFAKDLGDFEHLDALRARVRSDLERDAGQSAENAVRGELIAQLAARVPFEVPASLVEREIDRRLEDTVQQLMAQRVDPRQAGVDWNAFRESQRAPAREAVAGALVLDEVARREGLTVSDEEVENEVVRYAERVGRTAAAVRARLEKDGGLAPIYAGLRREKSIDFLLARATISEA